MAYVSPTIPRELYRKSIKGKGQRDFTAGIFDDLPAISVPLDGLADGSNIIVDDLGTRGRPGTHYISSGALPGDPLSTCFIPKAADGNAYFIYKIGTTLYSQTHHATVPAYFLTATEILDYTPTTPAAVTLTANENSQMCVFGDKAYLFDTTGVYQIAYDTVAARMTVIKLNAPVPTSKGTLTITAGGYTVDGAYYRDYLFTFVRLVGTVVTHESGGHNVSGETIGLPLTGRTASPIGGGSTGTITALNDKTLSGRGMHFTHVRCYCTRDYTLDSSGLVNNGTDRSQFVFNCDTALATSGGTSVTDSVTMATLQARLEQGNVCSSRFLAPIPSGPLGAIGKNFMFVGSLNNSTHNYCGLYGPRPRLLGYWFEQQTITTQRTCSAYKANGSKITFLSESRTETINTSTFSFFGSDKIPILGMPMQTSGSTGVPRNNFGTIADIDETSFIAVTNLGPMIFDGMSWSGDGMADKKVYQQMLNLPPGAVGAFGNNKYWIWYRSVTSITTYNDLCLVCDLNQKKQPWVKVSGVTINTTGSSFPMPGLYTGALAIDYLGKKLLCCYRRQYGTVADSRMYWIDTFDSNTNAIFARTSTDNWKLGEFEGVEDISGYFFTREWSGDLEFDRIRLNHIYGLWSIDPDTGGFQAGLEVDLSIYIDGVLKETIQNVRADDNEKQQISPSWILDANRISLKYTFNQTDWLFRGYDLDMDDIKGMPDESNGDDWIANQLALESNLEFAGSTFELSNLDTAVASYYAQGKIRERWTADYLNFFLTGTQGKFKKITGPDLVSESAIELTRNSGIDSLGFRRTFTTVFSSDTYSISVWLKTSSTSYEDAIILSPTAAMSTYFKLQVKSNSIKILDDSGNYKTYTVTATSWVHIVIEYASSSFTVYINGVADSPATSSGTIAHPVSLVLTIGQVNTIGAALDIFEPRKYTSALSEADVLYHYNDVISNNARASLPMR
jgi:hypothetical protein